jgi:hypothetical protein
MSDEQETNQTGEGAWDASSAFSSNGSDAVDPTDGAELTEIDDRTQFLGDLARVMQSTVASEQTRNTELAEGRRKAHVDGIREREAEEIEELRELAKDDIKGIDAWSEGEIKRIKLERERRIASRREQLQTRLEEHRSVVGREVDAVEAAVANYRTEMEQFFGRLGGETDPIAIASLAGKQPAFPDLKAIGPDPAPVTPDYGYVVSETHVPAETIADTSGSVADAVAAAQFDSGEQTETAEEPAAEAAVAEPTAEAEVAQDSDAVQADAEPAIAEAETATEPETAPEPEADIAAEADTKDEQDSAPAAESPLIGVMDPDAGNEPVETPWKSGVGAAAVSAEPTEVSEPTEAAQDTVDGAEQGAEEPVAVAAEAQVVMPRSSGAGSWLRWPSSSVDRSDPNQ